MNIIKAISTIVLITLLVCVDTACTSAVQTVEVTRIVPETIEVTKIIPETVIVTTDSKRNATLTPKSTISVDTRTELDQKTAYYEGVIVLAQYYTLLDQKLYTQAYQLLSTSSSDAKSLEEYLTGHEMVHISTYKLISAQPYYEWAETQGYLVPPDSETQKRFYIRVYAEGEGGMAGSMTNGIHTFFATLEWQNGEWKIDSINTSPQ